MYKSKMRLPKSHAPEVTASGFRRILFWDVSQAGAAATAGKQPAYSMISQRFYQLKGQNCQSLVFSERQLLQTIPQFQSVNPGLGWAPPGTGSPAPFGPRTPEKSPERVPRSGAPRVPKRVRPGVSKESEKSPTLLRLRGALFRDSGGPAPGDSFGTLFGLFQGSEPEGPGRPCAGQGRS